MRSLDLRPIAWSLASIGVDLTRVCGELELLNKGVLTDKGRAAILSSKGWNFTLRKDEVWFFNSLGAPVVNVSVVSFLNEIVLTEVLNGQIP